MTTILILLAIFTFSTAVMNSTRPYPKNIDEEIRQEYINAHKMGGYYYKANLEKAEEKIRNRKHDTAF
jgi:hypothetical protein